jgi:peptidoglycan glycosyltransferase
MNTQVRRVTTLVVVMFLALFGSATYTQYVKAHDLRVDSRNMRTFYESFNRDRGPIVVAGQAIASSSPVDDDFGYQRAYAAGPKYAPVTGFYSVVFGRTQIEWATDDVLQGTADSLFLSRVQDMFTGRQPQGGAVELTIDPAAQDAAWEGLGSQRGAVVALDSATGEILAMVSTPSYDPNDLAAHDTTEANDAYQELLDDPQSPLWNRAIAGNLYAPGSVFKLITAAAALESGDYTAESVLPAPAALDLPNTSVKLTNTGDSQCSATGQMTLAAALAISCNTAFGGLGMTLGQDALAAQAEAFGFGATARVPMPVTASVFPEDMDDAQTAMAAIGQYSDRVTPMQMAMVAAAIANDGVLRAPHLIRTERNADLEVITTTPVETLATPISVETAGQLKDMMIGAVSSGTAANGAIGGVSVGGKTGTAEKAPDEAPDNWFVSFGESAGQSVAVAVVVEDGGKAGMRGTGGSVAAPIARAVMKAVLEP